MIEPHCPQQKVKYDQEPSRHIPFVVFEAMHPHFNTNRDSLPEATEQPCSNLESITFRGCECWLGKESILIELWK